MTMAETLGNSWIVVAGLIGCALIATLYTIATAIRHQTYMHDLQVGVAKLHQQYVARMRAMQEAAQTDGVELLPAEPAEPKKPSATH